MQAHHRDINELPPQIKLAGDSTFLDQTILLIQMDGGKITDAHTQVNLANRTRLPGSIDEIRQHTYAAL